MDTRKFTKLQLLRCSLDYAAVIPGICDKYHRDPNHLVLNNFSVTRGFIHDPTEMHLELQFPGFFMIKHFLI